MQWNSLLPESIGPLDSLNLKAGVDQLPLGFSAEANRMSIRNYLIYRRRALDLLSPTQTDEVVAASNEADRLNRLGEPQLQVALNGVLVLKGRPTDLGKFETPAIDYEVGITNGSNNNAAPRTEKDDSGRMTVEAPSLDASWGFTDHQNQIGHRQGMRIGLIRAMGKISAS